MTQKIGVIGAGIAGAWIANQLTAAGHDVVVLEKSRGLGGRMATRRRDNIAFDHGAQFFTARSEAFQTMLDTHRHAIERWTPRVVTLGAVAKPFKRPWFEPHYVGVPGMGALCKSLLSNVTVELSFEASSVKRADRGWTVMDKTGTQRLFDWVICTAPAEQTKHLIPDAPLDDAAYSPCFALLAYLEQPPRFDAAVVRGDIIDWMAVTSSRPSRVSQPVGIIAHATPTWSQQHFETDSEQLVRQLVAAVQRLGVSVSEVAALHRWRYARVTQPHRRPFWINTQEQLAACGDWGVGANVEDAFTSANELLECLRSRSTLVAPSSRQPRV
ncbi:MAG: FAD-dependent oxidoreductase [Pseudomonadota bacterium]